MALPRAPRAVVFDMDGLLVDTEAAYRDTMIEVGAGLGHAMTPALHLQMVGLPWTEVATLLRGRFGDEFPMQDFYDGVKAAMAERIACASIALKTGVTEILDTLDGLRLPRAIATSSGHGSVSAQLGPSGLLARFDAVVASGDYARGKPHPDPFLEAARRLRCAPEDCLALEDSHNGVRAARAAGMMTVMVPDLLEATEEMCGLCVAVAGSLHDVRAWLAPGDATMERRHA